MYTIEILEKEHAQIMRMNAAMKNICIGILNGDPLEEKPFRQFIDFARNFGDGLHHDKEEKVLYETMLEHLGKTAIKMVKYGVYAEHDLIRLYVLQTEQALNRYVETKQDEDKLQIIANVTAYANLLKRHSNKENELVFPYAEQALSEEDQRMIDKESKRIEAEAESQDIQKKYFDLVTSLEQRTQA